MKLGIIGSGQIVQEFLPMLVTLEGVEVRAIQGRRREQVQALCRANGVPYAVTDFDGLLAAGIDTVYIATPNALHFANGKQALEAGLNVIMEKPITSNARETAALQRLSENQGQFLFEAITTLYLDSFQKIQEWLPQIGTVKLVQSQYSQYSRRYNAFRAGDTPPVFDPEKSGGALMDLNLYNLHLILGLFGEPETLHYYANMERGIDTSGVLVMQYHGFHAVCLAAKDCHGCAGAVIQGTDGCIRTNMPPNVIGTVTLERNDGAIESFEEPMVAARVVPEFTAFVSAVNRGDMAFCRKMLDKSAAVSRVQTAARQSAGIRFPADGEAM